MKHLEKLVRWKTRKGNEKLSSKKRMDLQRRWDAIKGWEPPHTSPYNYGDESDGDGEEDDDDAYETNVDPNNGFYVEGCTDTSV